MFPISAFLYVRHYPRHRLSPNTKRDLSYEERREGDLTYSSPSFRSQVSLLAIIFIFPIFLLFMHFRRKTNSITNKQRQGHQQKSVLSDRVNSLEKSTDSPLLLLEIQKNGENPEGAIPLSFSRSPFRSISKPCDALQWLHGTTRTSSHACPLLLLSILRFHTAKVVVEVMDFLNQTLHDDKCLTS